MNAAFKRASHSTKGGRYVITICLPDLFRSAQAVYDGEGRAAVDLLLQNLVQRVGSLVDFSVELRDFFEGSEADEGERARRMQRRRKWLWWWAK